MRISRHQRERERERERERDIGVGRFRILGGQGLEYWGGQIPSRQMTSQ